MSETNPDVEDLVSAQLVQLGYAGLYLSGVCACMADNIAPCGEIQGECQAGYRVDYPDQECPCGDGCDWHIQATKGGEK